MSHKIVFGTYLSVGFLQEVSVVANLEGEIHGKQVLNEAQGNTAGAVNNLVRIALFYQKFVIQVLFIISPLRLNFVLGVAVLTRLLDNC